MTPSKLGANTYISLTVKLLTTRHPKTYPANNQSNTISTRSIVKGKICFFVLISDLNQV
jgi:hypothetical protein